ncbi:MAG: GNAT family N-acetyltransferase [Pseudonocardia sp.]|nr:GNAT family N-acetyltransferase [Pseudonocardia sp.]
MAPLLDDPALHAFTGGTPATLGELRERYGRQVVGTSPDGSERWLNWIVRGGGTAVGYVQATLIAEHADLAWVIGTAHQGRGYAREAAEAVVTWLREQGVERLVAHIHPDHTASQSVARALNLTPTATLVDGELRWQWPPPESQQGGFPPV